MCRIIFLSLISTLVTMTTATAQQEKKRESLCVSTGVGINKVQGVLHKTFRSSVAFNSGIEKTFKHKWFVLLEAGFNTLRYDQQTKDENSNYLFQGTSSSLITGSVNAGRSLYFGQARWFVSPYLGVGYINIGKPRLQLHEPTSVITQHVVRKAGVLGRGGSRIGFNTKTKLLQTIYLDGSYWRTSIKIDESSWRSVSVFIGIRMAM